MPSLVLEFCVLERALLIFSKVVEEACIKKKVKRSIKVAYRQLKGKLKVRLVNFFVVKDVAGHKILRC